MVLLAWDYRPFISLFFQASRYYHTCVGDQVVNPRPGPNQIDRKRSLRPGERSGARVWDQGTRDASSPVHTFYEVEVPFKGLPGRARAGE